MAEVRAEKSPVAETAVELVGVPGRRWFERIFGICNASALIVAGNGDFLIGDDETNDIYLVTAGQSAVKKITPSLNELLRTAGIDLKKDGSEIREIDIEGGALVRWDGEEVALWIGSHSNRKVKRDKDDANKLRSAKKRKNRRLIVATNVPSEGQSLELLGNPITNLRDIVADLEEPLKSIAEPLNSLPGDEYANAGGWNIEGFAVDGQNRCFIGFRSPVNSGGKTLVLGFSNLRSSFSGGELHPQNGAWLALGKRGIRAMDWTVERGEFVIVAGPVDHVDLVKAATMSPIPEELPQIAGLAEDFAIFGWKGFGEQPRKMDFDLSNLRPESVAIISGGFYLISDDGKMERGNGFSCEDSRTAQYKKYCRAKYFVFD